MSPPTREEEAERLSNRELLERIAPCVSLETATDHDDVVACLRAQTALTVLFKRAEQVKTDQAQLSEQINRLEFGSSSDDD